MCGSAGSRRYTAAAAATAEAGLVRSGLPVCIYIYIYIYNRVRCVSPSGAQLRQRICRCLCGLVLRNATKTQSLGDLRIV